VGGEQNHSSVKVISAPIVEKPFYNKVGEKTEITEFYIQQSIQDYFIKFCESKVTKKQLESALYKIESPIKTLTVKIEIREGEWDRCEDYPVQSRIGKYVVLLDIVE
jgi:hypothetical protein